MVNSISSNYSNIISKQLKSEALLNKETKNEFSGFLDQAKSLISATNESEQQVKELTNDFIVGKNDNIHELMIAQEKSSILLQYTMQVRNNALEAYKELMRIPV